MLTFHWQRISRLSGSPGARDYREFERHCDERLAHRYACGRINAQLKIGEASMDFNGHARSFDLAEQRASNHLVRLVRKLRWNNMDDEAEQVSAQLTKCRFPPTETVIAGPWATD
jgi:hypothetical protein